MYPKGSKLPPPPKIDYFNRKVYSGAGVNVVRSVVSSAAFWLLYEYSTKALSPNHKSKV